MAIGFSPKHSEELPLNGLTPQQFLIVALATAEKLGWSISHAGSNGFIAYTAFSMSSYSEEVKCIIGEDSANIKSECTGSQMMDWGKNKSNIEAFTDTFTELRYAMTEEEMALAYEERKQQFVNDEEDALNNTPSSSKEKIGGVLSIFKPTEGFFITPILIILNVVLFILMAFSGVNIFAPESEQLIAWGANFRPVTLAGEWWRLLTCCFIHIGIFHLVMNMYALLYIGLLLEPYLGKVRFASAYLLTGIVASVASLAWHDMTVSAGASGAIFGMYGVFLAMLTTNLIEKSARKALLTSIGIFVAYNLANGLKAGIDNAAHIGGLVSGLLIGYAFYPSLKPEGSKKMQYVAIAVVTLLSLLGSAFVYQKLPNDIVKYNENMELFSSLEAKALKLYELPIQLLKINCSSLLRMKE
jgi:rhomboid protease GluP